MNRKSKSRNKRKAANRKNKKMRKQQSNSKEKLGSPPKTPEVEESEKEQSDKSTTSVPFAQFCLQKASEDIMKTKPASITDETVLNSLKENDKKWFLDYLIQRLPEETKFDLSKISLDDFKIPEIFPSDITWKDITKEPMDSEVSNAIFFCIGFESKKIKVNAPEDETENKPSTSSGQPSKKQKTKHEKILQLKITLKHITPLIWRRITVAATDTFEDLHCYIQEAMGWMSSHLHQFRTKSKMLIVPNDFDDPFNIFRGKLLNEEKTQLCQFFSAIGDSVIYLYDFGDCWEHKIVLENVLSSEDITNYPKCIAGERACPPEDCGGVPGYEYLLQVRGDPSHKDYSHLIEDWLEDRYPGFDPEKFDPESVDLTLGSCNIV